MQAIRLQLRKRKAIETKYLEQKGRNMSTQNVVERIISDGNLEAEKIINEAKLKAARIRQKSVDDNQRKQAEVEAEVREKINFLTEKKQAAARLECAKIALSAKRKVIDEIYAMVLARLVALDKEQTLALTARLLQCYAEQGDVVCLAKNFKYEDELKLLPVVAEKGLTFSDARAELDGGMLLIGTTSDKDLSYGAVLQSDREQFEAALAAEIFN